MRSADPRSDSRARVRVGPERRRRHPPRLQLLPVLLSLLVPRPAPATILSTPLETIFVGTGGETRADSPFGARIQTGAELGLPAASQAAILLGGPGTRGWDLESHVQTGALPSRLLGLHATLAVELTSRPLDGGDRSWGTRITPTVHRSAGPLELETGATWATGTTGAGRSSGAGIVWGLQHTRGALSLGWEGRTGSGVRSWSETGESSLPVDSVSLGEPSTVTHRARRAYGDTRLRLNLARPRWQAAADYGLRVGRDAFGPRAFGGVEAAWALRPGFALFATTRFEPSIPEQNLPARRVARAGLSLTRLPLQLDAPRVGARGRRHASAFRLRPLEPGRYEIACRLPSARRVVISGDFTDWQPREMERADDGWWRLKATLTSGPHQTSVAPDGGGWIAPPGLPAREDGFGGTVGLFVLP